MLRPSRNPETKRLINKRNISLLLGVNIYSTHVQPLGKRDEYFNTHQIYIRVL